MKLLHLRYALYVLLAVCFVGIVPASAQDEGAVNLTFDGGNVTVKHEVKTTAEVELTVGDQLYVLDVPVIIQIDDNMMLDAAKLSKPMSGIVGTFSIEPIALELVEGEYEKQFRTVTPGDDEVVVIYRADVINLYSETLDAGRTSVLEVTAVDSVGNTYDEDMRICNDVNPGAKIECEFVFKAPVSAELVDLQVKAVDYERFVFPVAEAEQDDN